jgi:hypothetical protein
MESASSRSHAARGSSIGILRMLFTGSKMWSDTPLEER